MVIVDGTREAKGAALPQTHTVLADAAFSTSAVHIHVWPQEDVTMGGKRVGRWLLGLLALFTLVPLAEVALLIWTGRHIGVWPSLGIILGTGLLGAWLARREGRRAWQRVREALGAGQLPGREVVEALLVLVAGVLLVTPGLLTDCAGLLLLLPPCRRWVAGRLLARLQLRVFPGGAGAPFASARRKADDDVIDVTSHDVPD